MLDSSRVHLFASCCLPFALVVCIGCGGSDEEPTTGKPATDPDAATKPSTDGPVAGLGIMVGDPTPTSAYVQVRLCTGDELVDRDLPGAPGVVVFEITPEGDVEAEPISEQVAATAEHDFIARVAFTDLKPGTTYVCRTRIGADGESLAEGPTATFKTLPGPDADAVAKFVVVTGMNYAKFHGDDRIDRKQHVVENNTELPPPYEGEDKHLGYPALETILGMQPDFFVGTGDNVYYDTPDNPRAETTGELRQKWHEQFVQPRYRDLFAKVPTYWEIDDHDYRIDDGDNTGDHRPTPEEGRAMMLEQLPVAAMGDPEAKTYRTRRVTKDLQIWLTENRMYRSPNAMPDGPEKTIWGEEQREWLKTTLADSDATFKVLISPTPMIGPDDKRKTDNHTNIGGFRHERDEFFTWLRESGVAPNFVIVCGDRHWQYHAISPEGIEEISCGALVDANSRPGRKAGDPASTDPEGTIRQDYLQTEPSGGFLQVSVTPSAGDKPATLKFEHFDERGKPLYMTARMAVGE